MKLVFSPASPFARKVRVVMIETDQTDDVEIVPVKTTPFATDPQVAAANPMGKIPALIREDGPAIYDSRVICRFLDARANGGLYPDSRIWEVLTLEATADGILESALAMVYEGRLRPEDKQFDGWVEAQWGKASGALDALNNRWMGHLNGQIDAGQIAVGCALGYLDFRQGARNWRQGRDGLAAWYEGFAQRPSMKATEPTD